MSIVRLIFVNLSAEDVPAAERVWKKECAPLIVLCYLLLFPLT